MKLREYMLYTIAIASLIMIVLGKIFSDLHYILFSIGRILLTAFFITFGLIILYRGIVLRKVTLVGRFGASDTYFGRSAVIQGILGFALSFVLGFTFIIGIKEIVFLAVPIFVAMVVSHFACPPKYSSPKIMFLKQSKEKIKRD